MNEISPVLVLSTGRCGSTMISQMLNKHPAILSMSEFFSVLGLNAFASTRVTGEHIWKMFSEPAKRMSIIERESFSELLYPFTDPQARFNATTLPPIMAVTVPHLTDEYEDLYIKIGRFMRSQSKALASDHYRSLFTWLGSQLGKKLWIERHGGSLLIASRLLRHFPEARVVHVFRDGRETTLSMSKHPPFRITLALMRRGKRVGLDLYRLLEKLERSDRLTCWLGKLQWFRSDIDSLLNEQANLSEFAELWSKMIETGHRVFGHFPPDRLLNLRFEDIQKNPDTEIKRLIRFISPELENDTWMKEVVQIPRQMPSKFALLDSNTQHEITAACRPGLERLGYLS